MLARQTIIGIAILFGACAGNTDPSGDATLDATTLGTGPDTDGDGFSDTLEIYLRTNPSRACPESSQDAAWPADFNNDRTVDNTDLGLFQGKMNLPANTPALRRFDINADGRVTIVDLTSLRPFVGKSCTPPVPEPSPDLGAPPDLGSSGDLAAGQAGQRIYVFYYLWWSRNHWHTKLGPSFPYSQSPWPLPAQVDAEGCNPVNLYSGNMLTDSPAEEYGLDDPGVIEGHVRLAANAGLSGFIVNWDGDGTASQTPTTNSNNRRLEAMIQAVHKVNSEGKNFKLWISLKVSARIHTETEIKNDLAYLANQYGSDSAWDHFYSPRIMVIWQGSNKYSPSTIHNVSLTHRGRFFLMGDEKDSWGDGRAADLDGDTYYWSTQNPYTNPSSFSQLQNLANQVRASGTNPDGSRKLWFAPLTPGYDSILNGGSTCVKRDNGTSRGATMRTLFNGNKPTQPDGWTFISWNEIAEGSYIEPLQRWGTFYLDVLSTIAHTP